MLKKLWILGSWMLMSVVPSAVSGQDERSSEGVQSSPFPAPVKTDSTFVLDDGPFLDTACLFRNDGPIVVDLEVDRVVGPDGFTLAELVNNGILDARADLVLPAFDVDFAGAPGVNPERDLISLNGVPLDPPFLTGVNNEWRLNTFRIPVELLLFPQDPGEGGAVEPVINTVQIDIDTANTDEVWCTAIDWVAIQIKVVRPVAFFHGILSQQSIWDAPWVEELEDAGFLTDRTDLGKLASIESNAVKIAAVVDRMRSRWGVDKVNIVSHSKGGLDSRHYVENRSTVERVVQIATPNAGAPLADYIQAGSAIILGIPATIALDLALPAGIQLTTFFMSDYNDFHPLNPEVAYTALAGDYRATLFDPINLIIGLLTPGRDDLIVPVASVHALNVGDELTFITTGNDEDAIHTKIHSSERVFNTLQSRVAAFGTSKILDALLPLSERTATAGGFILQGGKEFFPIPVGERTQLLFTLSYGVGDLDLAVLTPSGTRIDATTAPGLPGFEHGSFEDADGMRLEGILVEASEVGIYTLEVTAPLVTNPAGEEAFLVSGWLPESTLTLTAGTPSAALNGSDDLVVNAHLAEDGAGLPGMSVVASVVDAQGAMSALTLADQGGGDYSATLPGPLTFGLYQVVVRSEGTRSAGGAFSRESSFVASVASSTSSIVPPHADQGVDDNDNGLFDVLALEVGVDISERAVYRLVGELTDESGTTRIGNAQATAELDAGLQTLELLFDGGEIFASRLKGPYLLKTVLLAEEDPASGGVLPLDRADDAHTTAAYDFRDFEHEPVLLTGTADLAGVDIDGNGRFDLLRATLGIELLQGGANEWSAVLVNPGGDEVEFTSNAGTLPAGISEITLDFDGCGVRAAAEDGDYSIESFLFFGSSGSLIEPAAVASATLASSDFECDAGEVADVGVSVVAVPGIVEPGGTVDFSVTVTNGGTTEATSVILTNAVSENVIIESVTTSQGVCGAVGDVVTCNLETLAVDAAAFVDITTTVSGGDVVTDTSEVVAAEFDLDLTNNVAVASATVGSILEIPTLSDFGLALLALWMMGLGVAKVRQRPPR